MEYLNEAASALKSNWNGMSQFMLLLCFGLIYWVYQLKQQIKTCCSIQRELQYLGEHDMLSGLKNRNGFIKYAKQYASESFDAMVCDIDGLKLVNDTLGHDAGDRLICLAARVLQKVVPTSAQIFRMGGDEFLILIPQEEVHNSVMELETNLLEQVQFHNMHSRELPLSLSFGMAGMMSDEIKSMAEVIKVADARMYEKKTRGHAYILSWIKTKIQKSIIEEGAIDDRK